MALKQTAPKQTAQPSTMTDYATYLNHLTAHGTEKAPKDCVKGIQEDPDLYAALEKACKGVAMAKRERATEAGRDQLYSRISWTGRVAILVYTEERQGFGDITLGLKTTQLFREELGCTGNQYDVAFVVDKKAREATGDLGDGYGIEPILLPDDKFTAPGSKVYPQAFVRAPALQAKSGLQLTRSYEAMLSNSTLNLGFTEYAREDPSDALRSGLKPEELGFTVHYGLRDYQAKLLEVAPTKRRVFRTQYVAKISNPMVFNSVVCRPAKSAKALNEVVAGDKLKLTSPFGAEVGTTLSTSGCRGETVTLEQEHGGKLYFGYSNRSGTKFVKVVVALETKSTDHICIVHPSRNYIDKYWPSFRDEIEGKYKAKLEAAGFGVVEVVHLGAKVETELVVISTSPRVLRIVLPVRVQPSDMMALFMACEPTVIVTGNQSTSEALSAGKTLVYECLAFKQNQQFMEDLFNFGEVANGNSKQMTHFYEATKKLSRDILSGEKEVVSNQDCEDVAGLLANAQMEEAFHKLSELACTTRDLRARLVGMYIRDRLHRIPGIHPYLQAAERELGMLKYKATHFEAFFKALASITQTLTKL